MFTDLAKVVLLEDARSPAYRQAAATLLGEGYVFVAAMADGDVRPFDWEEWEQFLAEGGGNCAAHRFINMPPNSFHYAPLDFS